MRKLVSARLPFWRVKSTHKSIATLGLDHLLAQRERLVELDAGGDGLDGGLARVRCALLLDVALTVEDGSSGFSVVGSRDLLTTW